MGFIGFIGFLGFIGFRALLWGFARGDDHPVNPKPPDSI